MKNLCITRPKKAYCLKIFNGYVVTEKFYFLDKIDYTFENKKRKYKEYEEIVRLFIEEFLTGDFYELKSFKKKLFSRSKFNIELKSKFQDSVLNKMLIEVKEI